MLLGDVAFLGLPRRRQVALDNLRRTLAILLALAVIGDLFTPQERGKYQGLFGAVFGVLVRTQD